MQKSLSIVIVLLLLQSCSSFGERAFNISESENEAAWSRANVAMFKKHHYNFATTNKYIIASLKEHFYVTREKVGGQYIYSIAYYGPSYYDDIAKELEYTIRNVKAPKENPNVKIDK